MMFFKIFLCFLVSAILLIIYNLQVHACIEDMYKLITSSGGGVGASAYRGTLFFEEKTI